MKGADKMEYITLNNGIHIPRLGLGVYKISDGEVANVIHHALQIGYRSIDTAQFYENEQGVGKAIQKSDIHRED